MAICNIIDDPSRTAEEHEQITAHVRASGPTPPEGCRLVLLGNSIARDRGCDSGTEARER